MSSSLLEPPALEESPPRTRFYYGWVMVAIAAVAMTATLPGRTHGLGLITKQITDDPTLHVDETLFGRLNFWAVVGGAGMCVPIGWLIDRFGVRSILTLVSLGLAASVFLMARAFDWLSLLVALTLVRGLGQGSLSVVSLSMVGKWFTRRIGVAMGVYTVYLSIGFIVTILGGQALAAAYGWRGFWTIIAATLAFGLAPLGWLFSRSIPESIGLTVEAGAAATDGEAGIRDYSLIRALFTPTFWVFTAASALFNAVWSGLTLFNESLMSELGFDAKTSALVLAMMVVSGLPTNLFAGWLLGSQSINRVLAFGMAAMATTLTFYPFVSDRSHLIVYGLGLGVAGGIVTVVHSAIYARAFGRSHLGRIQTAAQIVSTLASASGPVLLDRIRKSEGTPTFFYAASVAALLLGLAALASRTPDRTRKDA